MSFLSVWGTLHLEYNDIDVFQHVSLMQPLFGQQLSIWSPSICMDNNADKNMKNCKYAAKVVLFFLV